MAMSIFLDACNIEKICLFLQPLFSHVREFIAGRKLLLHAEQADLGLLEFGFEEMRNSPYLLIWHHVITIHVFSNS